jgi:hypothetical protein
MQTLQRLLASSVMDALERREHVIVAPGSTDALLAELEGILAPSLPAITAPLAPAPLPRPAVASRLSAEPDQQALEAVVDEIAQRLLHSDHVDDIFADDGAIRRDALRALHETLGRYGRGQLELGRERTSEVGSRVRAPQPSSSPRGSDPYDEPSTPEPSDADRWAYPRLGRFALGSDGYDEHVSYFLGNLERALAVLDEEGPGPPSAPAELRCASSRPPAPMRTPGPTKAPRRPKGNGSGSTEAKGGSRRKASHDQEQREGRTPKGSQARLSSAPTIRRSSTTASSNASTRSAKARSTPRRGAVGMGPEPSAPRGRPGRSSRRPPKR